jgi:hypothetical protein
MQELVWSNLPWDWNMADDYLNEGTLSSEWGWTNVDQPGEGQVSNGDQAMGSMGMPVL